MSSTYDYNVTRKQVTWMVLAVIGALFALILFILLIVAWPFKSTPADKIGLSYGGGLVEGAHFQGIVQPASGMRFNGWGDPLYLYPVTTRNYIISSVANEGDRGSEDFITAASSDRVPVKWELVVTFKINTDKIRSFHESLGLKFHAWEDSGWDDMLAQTFRQPLESAVQRASRQHTADEYQSNPEVLSEVQSEVSSGLKDNINATLGDDYFCGPTFVSGQGCPGFQVVIKKATLPDDVVASYQQQKVSANAVVTAQNEAQAAKEQAEGQRLASEQLAGLFRDPAYVDFLRAQAMGECAKNGNCTLVIATPSTGVNVNVGS